MDGRNVLGLVTASLLLCTGAAAAATPCAVGAGGSGDPSIVVRRDKAGVTTMELQGDDVTIRKTYDRDSVMTMVEMGGQQVGIRLSGNEVAISAAGKTWKATTSDLERLEEAAIVLRASPAVRAARTLLDRTPLRPDAIGGNAMRLARALLGSLSGDSLASEEHKRWASTAPRQPRIVKAAQGMLGPGDCWDMYSVEAMRIANNYVDCGQACHWKGFWCMLSCGFIYDLRAEGAFMWFMKCNGGFYING